MQSLHHAQHRHAFGKPLIAQPLMRNVLADLALESEAAMVLALRLARAVDARTDAQARALVRVGTPAAKLWICKRAIHAVAECMEVWGGNGYVEEGPMPRLYRETPVNSIWEGSGNVMALDVLRALQREPDALPALEQEFAHAAGQYQAFDAAVAAWRALLADSAEAEFQARRIASGLARLWQAALLIQHAPAAVAQAFVASRLHADGGVFGELVAGADAGAILARAWPPAAAC
ncbi:putative acyl-CoA dehydrogenase AidB [compost metagenome]